MWQIKHLNRMLKHLHCCMMISCNHRNARPVHFSCEQPHSREHVRSRRRLVHAFSRLLFSKTGCLGFWLLVMSHLMRLICNRMWHSRRCSANRDPNPRIHRCSKCILSIVKEKQSNRLRCDVCRQDRGFDGFKDSLVQIQEIHMGMQE